jgi:hypothetical protein
MVSWSIESSIDQDYIFERAKMLGWLDEPPKVQVKCYRGMDDDWYVIEPYEGECDCPSLVHPPEELRNAR